jgi:cation:H+ antiporter
MAMSLTYVISGLVFLVWSADWFVDGSAVTAKHLGMPPLLIGMIIVGFGTSAPEMLVSAQSALNNSPELALGNAYGSNICNIALILGITAVIKPIPVTSDILKKELPVLLLVTGITIFFLMDVHLTRFEAGSLLVIFLGLLGWSFFQQKQTASDSFAVEVDNKLAEPGVSVKKAVFRLMTGFIVLIISSRLLVAGAIEIAQFFKISDLMIGLTIVAIGTSLPELASTVMAARRNEHDIALGNIIGSNLFNTLAVVGIAGLIHPMTVDPIVLSRDLSLMTGLTILLFIVGAGFKKKPGSINRVEGGILLLSYAVYMGWLVRFYTNI